jgi:hypothetical protein
VRVAGVLSRGNGDYRRNRCREIPPPTAESSMDGLSRLRCSEICIRVRGGCRARLGRIPKVEPSSEGSRKWSLYFPTLKAGNPGGTPRPVETARTLLPSH